MSSTYLIHEVFDVVPRYARGIRQTDDSVHIKQKRTMKCGCSASELDLHVYNQKY